MTTYEIELKALMLASLDGDAASHRELLDQLSRRLRAYYKGKLARFGRSAAEAEDLVQEAVLAIHFKTQSVAGSVASSQMSVSGRRRLWRPRASLA
jgi:DNA-directed RNA polymerase specialized sigma24 family protein